MTAWLLRLRLGLRDVLRAEPDEVVAFDGDPWTDLGRRLAFITLVNTTPIKRPHGILFKLRRRAWLALA